MIITSSISTIASSIPSVAPDVGRAALTLMQTFATISSFSTETNPLTRAQYSKFANNVENEKDNEMIDSKDGMTLIYLPALVVSAILITLPSITNLSFLPQQSLAGELVFVHFLKRILEVFYLHKYSGEVSKGLSTLIGMYYAIVSILIICVANPVTGVTEITNILGTGLFSIGILGNFYHHYILAGLRDNNHKPSGRQYVAPHGGLFEYVAAPHYFLEVMGWLGIAIAANHLNAYLVFTSMTSYLSGRAGSQNEWNRSKFSKEDW
eukprot:CAMPEP_0184858422 /NCGR_PEP_ID=MMETSP0580-20130426/3526_1 /TAXON_ID=1118495 /ORGANISM="Dactyliosolen fragilissimus" /LENGTH=265 /DNA_ID=CAMNT_0027354553 /DNA_START=190 /DNA_END=984 /DNA_ORIENTATION=-